MRPFQRILHPIDLDHPSLAAFCHALKLAVAAAGHAERQDHALLEMLYCQADRAPKGPFPHVRERLVRWGVLPEAEATETLADLGLVVRKQITEGEVEEEIALEVESRQFDLLVMACQARAGWSYFLHTSLSARSLQNTQLPGLLFPPGVTGFVQANNGELELERVLLPVTAHPDAWPALQAVARLLWTLQPARGGEVLRICVGRDEDFPEHRLPPLPPDWLWTRKTVEGEPVATLSGWAQAWRPQLAALASAGQRSRSERWFGSTAEQLLNEFRCPVLVAPTEES